MNCSRTGIVYTTDGHFNSQQMSLNSWRQCNIWQSFQRDMCTESHWYSHCKFNHSLLPATYSPMQPIYEFCVKMSDFARCILYSGALCSLEITVMVESYTLSVLCRLDSSRPFSSSLLFLTGRFRDLAITLVLRIFLSDPSMSKSAFLMFLYSKVSVSLSVRSVK